MKVLYNKNIKMMGRLRLINILGILGVAGATFLLVTLIAMHFLRPDFDYINNYVSDYANGPYGFLFRTALFIHGIGNGAMALGFATILAGSKSGRRGVTLLGLAAVGIILGGLFSADPGGAPRTISGVIHSTAAFASFPVEIIALLFFASAFSVLSGWNSFIGITKIAAVTGIISFIILLVFINMRIMPGLIERAVSLPLYLWEFLAGTRLAMSRSALVVKIP